MTALLEIKGLKTYFHTDAGTVKAVDEISLHVDPGRTLGIVGESGSGKSVTSLTVMKLLPQAASSIEAGEISFLGQDLIKLPDSEMRKIRGKDISMIFQEPGTALNPVHRVGDQVMEAILLHQNVSTAEARQRTIELFEEVGIENAEEKIRSYPHEMSGGQKQRVMIAMALSCKPKLLIADEPTTALDVTIQAQILELLRDLRDNRQMSLLFITHDLGVIAEIADDVAVMYRGRVVEYKPVVEIFENPQHPYTKGLLACRPQPDMNYKRLPTVSDFMKTTIKEDGELELTEITPRAEDLERMKNQGRGRLLSPEAELKQLGHPWKPEDHPSDTKLIPADQQTLLSVQDLKVYFPLKKGVLSRVYDHVRAVDGISFNVYRGQTLGLVGESGCGKTTTGRAIMKLVQATEGKIFFEGTDLVPLTEREMKPFRRKIQIIFQDPYASLNPRLTVQGMLTEAMKVNGVGSNKNDRLQRAAQLLVEVGLLAEHLGRYPHEFSGGQRQRICIARALAVEPEFIICDESVSALDVSVQAQVCNLLKDLQEERNLTYIFISHDLSVVKFMSDMMAVMNDGKIVEFGPAESIYAHPQQEYTQKLISAIPNDSLDNIRTHQRQREERQQAVAKG
ncbi:Glutathione import ATP-binding protein GsiA [Polystyrenella longa]|uniref:Glutathione import ATP-binding protein GsiA n=1 Tax=Polystyrenella longa TaxID=2528007 RepID=A0A518CPA5_9PLAN|nr:ABC transporter ATP-binding protein [Polystyrenella longa]QDU81052.1 Glutathione import ATP-binding protein GsiA [Polystyrenella longa]